ncbi:MAG: hypothetical protein SFW36_11380 [Leptolyngbyaceae cyanobacterium bins.59]|nr:hypothetical protein [Leptolyngbyaceae cyanobacterium bins.59]
MTIAIEARRANQVVSVTPSKSLQFFSLIWRRFWWHSHAYSVAIGILVLLGLGLTALWLHRLLIHPFQQNRKT